MFSHWKGRISLTKALHINSEARISEARIVLDMCQNQ
jgi:hypothetical protein